MTGLSRDAFNRGFSQGYNSAENQKWTVVSTHLVDALSTVEELENDLHKLDEEFEDYGSAIGVICAVLKDHLHEALMQDAIYNLMSDIFGQLYELGRENIQMVLHTHIKMYQEAEDNRKLTHKSYSRATKLLRKVMPRQ